MLFEGIETAFFQPFSNKKNSCDLSAAGIYRRG